MTEARETSNSNQTWKQTFGYDRFGNRTSYQKFIGTTQIALDNKTFPQIDATTNRILTTQGYVFDKNGNLTLDAENRSFIFNGDNKQTEVRDVNNQPIGKYFYDGDGKRVKKEVYSGGQISETTIFVYSGGKLVAEYSTAAPPQNPTTNYTATDQLGSPRVITNAFGQVTSRRDFHPFGEELLPDGTYRKTTDKYGATDSVRQRFTGYEKDTETGLDFAEARYYNNQHGRFTAVDPLLASGKSANPQTFNRYVYVGNNPIILTDPTGLFGDYYDRNLNYIGSDGKDDGKYYYANVTGSDNSHIYVDNIEEFTLQSSGATCDIAYQCAGVRDFGRDRANYIAFDQFTRGFGSGASNEVKSFFDVPNYDLTPNLPGLSMTLFAPKISLSSLGVANPWFNYTSSQNQFQAIGQAAGEAAVDVGVAYAGGKAPSFGGSATGKTIAAEEGSFSIINWNGYPQGYPRPTGPFRLLEGAEYDTARKLANTTNQNLRKELPFLKDFQFDIHEITPVKFGGSPTDISNKIFIPRTVHQRQFTPWWNRLQKDIEQ